MPVKATTNEAISFFYDLQIKPDLIYVDAAHDEESVYQDIVNYFPLVKGHGVICGDDYSWGDGGVKRAVNRFAKENGLIVVTSWDWFWFLKEQ